MPTVPTEQNRVGIAGVTDAKLQAGDYSGTGLQALGAGLRQLGGTGAKIAGEVQERQDRDDELEVKKAWNAYAEGARGIRADALGKFDADPRGMLESMTRDYGGLRDWIRSGLKNDRQRGQFDHVIGERFDYDISGALGSAEQAMRRGQDQQGMLIERNAADDAIDNHDNPDLFDKHLQTGADSIAGRAAARGDDPATIERSVTAYGSGIRRRVLQDMIDRDPTAAADRYRLMRDAMTPADRQATQEELFEPLAHALAAREVDKLLLPEERDGTLSPERRVAIAQGIEALPLSEALKRYALDDLDLRGSLQTRARKQAADTARETSLATADQLGSGFTSILQIPAAVRRDLDDGTDQALRSLAQANANPTPVAPQGLPALRLNLMATYQPADFARQDLRLVRDLMAPAEYDAFVRRQQAMGGYPPSGDAATQQRIGEMAGRPALPAQALGQDGTNGGVLSRQASFDPNAADDGASFQSEKASVSSGTSVTFAMKAATQMPEAGDIQRTAAQARSDDKERHGIYTKGDGKRYAGGQHVRSPEDQASNRTLISADLSNPALMAFLNLISIAEGPNGHYNYYERYGRTKLKDLKQFYYGTKRKSDASGMFQIQGNTYDEIALARLGLNDFSPRTQKMIALFLMRGHGIRQDLLNDDIRSAIAKGADIWASLPDPDKNRSKHMKSGTNRLQGSTDIDDAIAKYERLKVIWEKRLGTRKSN